MNTPTDHDSRPLVPIAALEPAVAEFAALDPAPTSQRILAAITLAEMVQTADLGRHLRELLADVERWTDGRHDPATGLEFVRVRLAELIGDPKPEVRRDVPGVLGGVDLMYGSEP